jgi:hypothetical protein
MTNQNDVARQDAQRAHDEHARFIDQLQPHVIGDARAVIQLAALVNGGAAVALLTFVGGLIGRHDSAQIASVAKGIMWFAGGVLSALLCAMAAYVTNYMIGEAARASTRVWQHPFVSATRKSSILRWIALAFHATAIFLALASALAFVRGCVAVYHAVIHLAPG